MQEWLRFINQSNLDDALCQDWNKLVKNSNFSLFYCNFIDFVKVKESLEFKSKWNQIFITHSLQSSSKNHAIIHVWFYTFSKYDGKIYKFPYKNHKSIWQSVIYHTDLDESEQLLPMTETIAATKTRKGIANTVHPNG